MAACLIQDKRPVKYLVSLFRLSFHSTVLRLIWACQRTMHLVIKAAQRKILIFGFE